MSEKNKAIVRRFFEEIYSNGRVELIDELMSPDYLAHGPGSQTRTGQAASVRAEGLDAVKKSIEAHPSDMKVTIEEQVAEGDTVVSRLAMSAGGIQWAVVAIQKVVDGKLVETWRIANRG